MGEDKMNVTGIFCKALSQMVNRIPPITLKIMSCLAANNSFTLHHHVEYLAAIDQILSDVARKEDESIRRTIFLLQIPPIIFFSNLHCLIRRIHRDAANRPVHLKIKIRRAIQQIRGNPFIIRSIILCKSIEKWQMKIIRWRHKTAITKQ